MGPLLKDRNWIQRAFLVRKDQLERVDQQNRFFTSASLKYTDTTPGGNFAINPLPQFTRFADPKALVSLGDRVPSAAQKKYSTYANSKGMGRYYSEAFDDNAQIINMRFGVPHFNSLTQFFTSFYNTSAGHLARTGRARGAFYAIGRAAGFVVSIISWKILAVHLLGMGLRFALNKPASKFYYLKPTMPMYWNAVTTIVNQIAVNRGIVPRIGGGGQAELNNNYQFTPEALTNLHNLLPDIFKKEGGIDVYAMATRAQRLARRRQKAMEEVLNSSTNMNLSSKMNELSAKIQQVYNGSLVDKRPDYNDYLSKWFATEQSKPKMAETTESGDTTVEMLSNKADDNVGFGEFLLSELDDGGAFVSFKVDSTGSINEGFSNSTADSELANKINNMSSSSRSTSFDFAGGNLSDGILGKMAGSAISAVKDLAAGTLEGIGMSGLAALGGSAFVDIPKHWQSSSANLPRANYTITLRSPYGNPVSQLLNLHIPLAMLLAAVLPLSTGRQSYTSPFLLELYDQGRCQTRLGIIDSLNISRGVGNLGFNNQGSVMAIEVTFSVLDLSSIMHMPISEGFSLENMQTGINVGSAVGGVAGAVTGGIPGAVAGAGAGGAVGAAIGTTVDAASNVIKSINNILTDDDNVFTDYLAVLAGMSVSEQIYSLNKFKLNLTKTMAQWNSWASPAHFASFAGDSIPGRLASSIFKGTAR